MDAEWISRAMDEEPLLDVQEEPQLPRPHYGLKDNSDVEKSKLSTINTVLGSHHLWCWYMYRICAYYITHSELINPGVELVSDMRYA